MSSLHIAVKQAVNSEKKIKLSEKKVKLRHDAVVTVVLFVNMNDGKRKGNKLHC